MRTKIRGLVFVGFAAAIFAASAHAEQSDAQTVTSKQFTEATYEKKAEPLSEAIYVNGMSAMATQ